jgi:galactose mutarotase-like enzyme
MTNSAIRIENETQTAYMEALPHRGGIVVRWNINGQEIFYLDEERLKDPTLSVRGGNPILFPICGNLPDNTYTVGDQTYTLIQHGFARNLPWSVVSQTATTLTVALESTPETLTVYPFEFLFKITYTLKGESLEVRSHITNRSRQTMPFSLGFHPYFAVANKSNLTFDLPATQLDDNVAKQTRPFMGAVDLNVPELDIALFPVTAQTSAIKGDSFAPGVRAISLTCDKIFTTLVVWTVEGKPFVCLEPWTSQRNALNTGTDLTHLEPGTSIEAVVTMTAQV